MRRGQNPAKFVTGVAKPQRVTIAVITYAPFLKGYYAQALKVLEVCLRSIQATTTLPYDLMVFDNGSCDEVQDYLMRKHRAGLIQYLILSKKNLGKAGAWNLLFSAAPGEVIAYSDSDVLFLEGWLERSLEILNTFPDVGMVTARPFRTPPSLSSRTIEWGKKMGRVVFQQGQLIPWEVFAEMFLNLGRSEEEVRRQYDESEDILLTFGGISAFVGADHWQFLACKKTLLRLLPLEGERPMGNVRQLDQAINEISCLRLMVTDPLVVHIGNSLYNIKGDLPSGQTLPGSDAHRRRLRDLSIIRRGLLYLHDRIFRLYY